MDLHGDDVRPRYQAGRLEFVLEVLARFHCGRCAGGVENRPRRHVGAEHLGAVDVHDGAVVPQDGEREPGDVRRVVDGQRVPKVVGDVATCDDRCFVAIAEPELRGPGIPARVVEIGFAPSGSLVAAVVQVVPIGTSGDQLFRMHVGHRPGEHHGKQECR